MLVIALTTYWATINGYTIPESMSCHDSLSVGGRKPSVPAFGGGDTHILSHITFHIIFHKACDAMT